MRGTVSRRRQWGLAALVLALGACDGVPGRSADTEVELIDWWTAPGESDAIAALLGYFQQQYPRETPLPMAIDGSTEARNTIAARMNEGDPPDTFQANGGWDLLTWVLRDDFDDRYSLMDYVDSDAWANYMPPAVLQTVNFNGHCYGVPVDIHRENTLFYNAGVFARFGLSPPLSIDEMFADAAELQANGIVAPIALGTADGTLPIIFFENLLVSRAGAAYYQSFMGGYEDPFGPELAAAVDDLATLLTYANANALSLSWRLAADRVIAGDAALTIMGDWDKAYMKQMATPYVPGDDLSGPGPFFGATPMPGTAGTFVFTTDTFGLPKGALNKDGTKEMLAVFGSNEGQDIFNPTKGSISPRSDIDVSKYDTMSRQTITDFRQASQIVAATSLLAPPEFMDQANKALLQFVADGDKSTLIHSIANWYDVLTMNALRPLP
jgi:glucose/mannose transport system substrate-binding protein